VLQGRDTEIPNTAIARLPPLAGPPLIEQSTGRISFPIQPTFRTIHGRLQAKSPRGNVMPSSIDTWGIGYNILITPSRSPIRLPTLVAQTLQARLQSLVVSHLEGSRFRYDMPITVSSPSDSLSAFDSASDELWAGLSGWTGAYGDSCEFSVSGQKRLAISQRLSWPNTYVTVTDPTLWQALRSCASYCYLMVGSVRSGDRSGGRSRRGRIGTAFTTTLPSLLMTVATAVLATLLPSVSIRY
jgi:hypothetical protein